VLHIASAGNYGNPDGTGENCTYPSRWETVVATAVTMSSDVQAPFSSTSRGSRSPRLAARSIPRSRAASMASRLAPR
jgi:hypothetical protein